MIIAQVRWGADCDSPFRSTTGPPPKGSFPHRTRTRGTRPSQTPSPRHLKQAINGLVSDGARAITEACELERRIWQLPGMACIVRASHAMRGVGAVDDFMPVYIAVSALVTLLGTRFLAARHKGWSHAWQMAGSTALGGFAVVFLVWIF